MISKVKNTFEHKYDQQYGQSNQNNMISNMVRVFKMIQLKQYDQ